MLLAEQAARMCGRYVLAGDPVDYMGYFSVDRTVTETLTPSYNVAPTDPVYAIAEWDDLRLLGTMQWGLVPHWVDEAATGHINARAETVATKAAFRYAFANKRCLLPADGFYEWEAVANSRRPHFIHRADGRPLGFAGIWATRTDPSGRSRRTCAIVTTAAAGVVSRFHDRMPVMLRPEVWDGWLDRSLTDPNEVEALLQPIAPDRIVEHPVSTLVNSVRNDGPELVDLAPDQARLI